MDPILFLNSPQVGVGLNTYTYTVPTTGLYVLTGQFTVPSAVATGDGAGSGSTGTTGPAVSSSLSVLIKQNGTTIYTSPTLSPTQSSFQFLQHFLFTAADAISVVVGSSNANDELLNTVQYTLSIGNY